MRTRPVALERYAPAYGTNRAKSRGPVIARSKAKSSRNGLNPRLRVRIECDPGELEPPSSVRHRMGGSLTTSAGQQIWISRPETRVIDRLKSFTQEFVFDRIHRLGSQAWSEIETRFAKRNIYERTREIVEKTWPHDDLFGKVGTCVPAPGSDSVENSPREKTKITKRTQQLIENKLSPFAGSHRNPSLTANLALQIMIFPPGHQSSERDKITTVPPLPRRRAFLNRLALGAAGLSLSRLARAAAATPLKATKLANNFIEITGAGANILLLTGPDGSLMVDGGLTERSPELLKLVADQSGGRPVRVLFNTHWHCECTGSNEVLAKTGTKIISHENTRLWESTDVIVEWQKRTYQPLPKAALPNDTFYALTNTTRKMNFGDEPVEYGHLPQAHTDGDIYVYFPGPNILMAGDVVSAGSYPILDYSSGGWIGGMSQASKTLLKVANANTRIIPGTGPILTRADLEAQSEMLATVMTTLVKMMKEGMGAKDMLAAGATKQFDAKWGDPELFVTNAYPGLWGHVRELGGIV